MDSRAGRVSQDILAGLEFLDSLVILVNLAIRDGQV